MTNEKKDKIKDKIFIWICVGLIAIITLLAVLFYNTDSNVEIKKESNIQITNDNLLKNDYQISQFYLYPNFGYKASFNNENLNNCFISEFNEGRSVFREIYFDLEYVNKYLSMADFYDYDNFHPYLSWTLHYEFDAEDYVNNLFYNKYFRLPYWFKKGYFDNDTNLSNFILSNNPTDYIEFFVPHDYYYENIATFDITIYYDIYNYIDKSTGLIPTTDDNYFMPTLILPIIVYSDSFETNFELIEMGADDTLTSASYFGSFYYEKPNIEDSDYNVLYNQVTSLSAENKRLQNDLVQAQQNASSQYARGYQNGLNDGAILDLNNNGMKTIFNSILSYPINFLSSVFNFEFFGINVASLIFFLISTGIVLWIIKRLWK